MIGRLATFMRKRALGRRSAGALVNSSRERAGPVESHERPASDRRWIGYVDRVEGGRVKGWCCDLSRPNESVCVAIDTSSGKRFIVVASQHREDVATAGFGNGNHGFEIDLRKMLVVGETASICFLDSKVPIGKGPISLDPQQALLTQSLPPPFLDMLRELATELRLKHAEMQAAAHSGADMSATSRSSERQRRAAR